VKDVVWQHGGLVLGTMPVKADEHINYTFGAKQTRDEPRQLESADQSGRKASLLGIATVLSVKNLTGHQIPECGC
jgi:hypothetical protein